MTFTELLAREFSPYANLSPEQLRQAAAHHDLLIKWNARMNLTRIESLEEVVRLHYCESFFLGAWLPVGPIRVADVGTGPGFPGIPVAILRHDLQVALIEANKRKCVFLREATRDLPNVRVFEGRVQEFKDNFDWVISRAVAIPEIIESRIATNFALLISKSDNPSGWTTLDLPWGSSRVLSVSRETVPRETVRP